MRVPAPFSRKSSSTDQVRQLDLNPGPTEPSFATFIYLLLSFPLAHFNPLKWQLCPESLRLVRQAAYTVNPPGSKLSQIRRILCLLNDNISCPFVQLHNRDLKNHNYLAHALIKMKPRLQLRIVSKDLFLIALWGRQATPFNSSGTGLKASLLSQVCLGLWWSATDSSYHHSEMQGHLAPCPEWVV